MLSKYIDHRLLLVVNAVSLLCGNLFVIIMGTLGPLQLPFPGYSMKDNILTTNGLTQY